MAEYSLLSGVLEPVAVHGGAAAGGGAAGGLHPDGGCDAAVGAHSLVRAGAIAVVARLVVPTNGVANLVTRKFFSIAMERDYCK